MFDPIEDTPLDHDVELASHEKVPIQRRISSTTYLDGLRGLAALLVYLSHNIAYWYGPDTAFERGFGYHGEYMFATLPFIRIIFTGGSAAVALFFVLSGYVLSLSPLHKLQQGKVRETRLYLLEATVRRPFRLFLPVAAVSLMFIAVMHLPLGLAPELQWPKPEPTIASELQKWQRAIRRFMDISSTHNTSTAWFPYDPPVWTMNAELKGSLFLYGLLAASTLISNVTSKQRLLMFALVGILLLLLNKWEVAAFMFGAMIAALDLDEKFLLPNLTPRSSSWAALAALTCGWYLVGQPANGNDGQVSLATPGWYYLTRLTPPSYFEHEYWRFWPVIGASMILWAITKSSWLQHLLGRPLLRYLGRISFSLYLVHIPIIWTIGDRLARVLGKFRFEFRTPFDNVLPMPDYGPVGLSTGFWVWQASLLPINLYVASILTERVEGPTNRFGRWLASSIRRLMRP